MAYRFSEHPEATEELASAVTFGDEVSYGYGIALAAKADHAIAAVLAAPQT